MRYALFFWLILMAAPGRGQTTFFRQEFLLGPDVNTYKSASPDAGQFTDIIATSGTEIAIKNEKLCLNRQAGGGSGRVFRFTDFPGPPRSLYVEFKISGSTTASNDQAIDLLIGNFSNAGIVTPNAEVYAKIGMAATGGGWQLRQILAGGSSNVGPVITTETPITWILNNTGARIEYINPDGSGTTTLMQNDSYDLWVGGQKVLSGVAVTTPTQQLTDFKLNFDAGLGEICFDDFWIRDVSGMLPVSLTAFSGQVSAENRATLFWQTAAEKNAAAFTLERSPDARHYEAAGTLPAAGTAAQTHHYVFTDPRTLTETTYYRLRQTDADGRQTLLRAIALAPQKALFRLLQNPVAAGRPLRVQAATGAVLKLLSFSGKEIALVQQKAPQGFWLWPAEPLPAGVYVLQNRTDGQAIKVIMN